LKSDLNLDDFMMKVFYRDYMKEPEVIEDYKFPPKPFIPKILPSKEELKIFYDALQPMFSSITPKFSVLIHK